MFSPSVRNYIKILYAFSVTLLLSPSDKMNIRANDHQNTLQIVKDTVERNNVHLEPKKVKTKVFSSHKTEIATPKKRDPGTMEHDKESQKREMIKQLNKIVPLTQHGMLYLARYSAIALHEMVKFAEKSLEATDPFRYLCSLGEKYTTELDMKWYHSHRQRLGIPLDDTEFVSDLRMKIVQMNVKANKDKKRQSYTTYQQQKEDRYPARHHAPGPWKPVEWDCGETPQETITKLHDYIQDNSSNPYLDIMLGKKIIPC